MSIAQQYQSKVLRIALLWRTSRRGYQSGKGAGSRVIGFSMTVKDLVSRPLERRSCRRGDHIGSPRLWRISIPVSEIVT
jgi:hypothetical protein